MIANRILKIKQSFSTDNLANTFTNPNVINPLNVIQFNMTSNLPNLRWLFRESNAEKKTLLFPRITSSSGILSQMQPFDSYTK